ncbi:hypothetical protein DRN50_07370, partial [Thermococci archaeon]
MEEEKYMVKKPKKYAIAALLAVFILITSSLAVTGGSTIEDNNGIDTTQSTNSENHVVRVDVKVRITNGISNEWTDAVDILVGDLVDFKVTVTNVNSYDLKDVVLLDVLPPSNILMLIGDTLISSETESIDVQDGKIIAMFKELKNGSSVFIRFTMKALQSSTVEGVSNSAVASASLDPKYETDILSLKELVNDKKIKIQQLTQEITSKQEKLAEINERIEQLNIQEETLNKEITMLKEQMTQKIQSKVELENEINNISSEISILTTEINSLQQSIQDIQIEINEKQQKLTEQQNYLKQLQNTLTQKQQKLIELKQEIEQTKQGEQTNEEYIQNLQNQINEIQQNIQQINTEIQNTQQNVDILSPEIEQLSLQKNNMEKESTVLNSELYEKQAIETGLESEMQSLNLEIENLGSVIADDEDNLQQVQILKSDKLQSADELTSEVNLLEEEKSQLEEEIIILSQQIQTQEEQIQQLILEYGDSAVVHVYEIPDHVVPDGVVDKKVWDQRNNGWEEYTEIKLGDAARFNITLRNLWDVPVRNIIVKDILPRIILVYNDNATPYEPDINDGVLIWKIEELQPGETYSLEFDTIGVNEGVGVNIVNVSIGIISEVSPEETTVVYIEDQATVKVVKTPDENNPPVANDDYIIVDEDTIDNVIDVLLNDTDPDPGDTITLNGIIDPPQHGKAYTDNGKIFYTPDKDYNGQDILTYQINDTHNAKSTAQVFITVNNVNDPPVAVDDSFTTQEDTPVTVDVLSNDYDVDGDKIDINSIKSPPTNGSAAIEQGHIKYTPDTGYIGVDSFVYEISDGNNGFDTATVTITVNPENPGNENHPPTAVDDEVTVVEDSTNNIIDVLNNDYDLDGDIITINSIVSQPTNGSAEIQDNVIIYTPDPGYNGSDSLIYNITDNNGGYDVATVNITVAMNTSSLIIRPREGYLYFHDREILNISRLLWFFDCEAFAIGPITFEINISNNSLQSVERIEFYVDDEIVGNITNDSYNFTLNDRRFGIYTVKVVVYGDGKSLT